MARCKVCGKIVWPWQRRVRSLDRLLTAHKKCKPEGFHAEAVKNEQTIVRGMEEERP